MSRRDFFPYTALSASSMAGNIISPTVTLNIYEDFSVQFIWTGTPTGAFFVEGSTDNVNFQPLSLSPAPVAAGSADNWLVEVLGLTCPYFRLRYARTSGTGFLTANIFAKMG